MRYNDAVMSGLNRSRTVAGLCVLLGALWWMSGCTMLGLEGLVATRIVVKSARQSIKEQVLGAYDELPQEVYALAGVRSVDPLTGQPEPPPPMSESRRRALAAARSMEFNRDDVLSFKRLRYVGEGTDGFLVVLEDRLGKLQEEDAWRFKLVHDITAEENADRRAIMDRLIETTPELQGDDGLEMVKAILAEKHRQEAEPGMRLQLPDGTWVTKGEAEGGE